MPQLMIPSTLIPIIDHYNPYCKWLNPYCWCLNPYCKWLNPYCKWFNPIIIPFFHDLTSPRGTALIKAPSSKSGATCPGEAPAAAMWRAVCARLWSREAVMASWVGKGFALKCPAEGGNPVEIPCLYGWTSWKWEGNAAEMLVDVVSNPKF